MAVLEQDRVSVDLKSKPCGSKVECLSVSSYIWSSEWVSKLVGLYGNISLQTEWPVQNYKLVLLSFWPKSVFGQSRTTASSKIIYPSFLSFWTSLIEFWRLVSCHAGHKSPCRSSCQLRARSGLTFSALRWPVLVYQNYDIVKMFSNLR